MPKIDNNVVMEALYHLIDRLQIYAFFLFHLRPYLVYRTSSLRIEIKIKTESYLQLL